MGSKLTNSQVASSPADMSKGISAAFGDTEEEARKRKEIEDNAAAANAQQGQQQTTGQVPSAWDTIASMGSDAATGAKEMAADAGGVWNTMMNKDKKKK